MENREAFTGISVETEECVEEVNWRQHNPRGRGNNRGNYRGNYHQTNYNSQGKSCNIADVQCLLCGLKGHIMLLLVELIKQDKQQYWNNRKGYTKRSIVNNNTRQQQINEVDNNAPIDEVENQEEDFYDQDYKEMDDINFPTSDLTEEEDQVYYYNN